MRNVWLVIRSLFRVFFPINTTGIALKAACYLQEAESLRQELGRGVSFST